MPAKKKTSKKGARKAGAVAVATTSKTIALQPTAKQAADAKKCIERSGKIRVGFKEVTLTKLPKTIAPVLSFID
jgi:hypothetical protein